MIRWFNNHAALIIFVSLMFDVVALLISSYVFVEVHCK